MDIAPEIVSMDSEELSQFIRKSVSDATHGGTIAKFIATMGVTGDIFMTLPEGALHTVCDYNNDLCDELLRLQGKNPRASPVRRRHSALPRADTIFTVSDASPDVVAHVTPAEQTIAELVDSDDEIDDWDLGDQDASSSTPSSDRATLDDSPADEDDDNSVSLPEDPRANVASLPQTTAEFPTSQAPVGGPSESIVKNDHDDGALFPTPTPHFPPVNFDTSSTSKKSIDSNVVLPKVPSTAGDQEAIVGGSTNDEGHQQHQPEADASSPPSRSLKSQRSPEETDEQDVHQTLENVSTSSSPSFPENIKDKGTNTTSPDHQITAFSQLSPITLREGHNHAPDDTVEATTSTDDKPDPSTLFKIPTPPARITYIAAVSGSGSLPGSFSAGGEDSCEATPAHPEPDTLSIRSIVSAVFSVFSPGPSSAPGVNTTLPHAESAQDEAGSENGGLSPVTLQSELEYISGEDEDDGLETPIPHVTNETTSRVGLGLLRTPLDPIIILNDASPTARPVLSLSDFVGREEGTDLPEATPSQHDPMQDQAEIVVVSSYPSPAPSVRLPDLPLARHEDLTELCQLPAALPNGEDTEKGKSYKTESLSMPSDLEEDPESQVGPRELELSESVSSEQASTTPSSSSLQEDHIINAEERIEGGLTIDQIGSTAQDLKSGLDSGCSPKNPPKQTANSVRLVTPPASTFISTINLPSRTSKASHTPIYAVAQHAGADPTEVEAPEKVAIGLQNAAESISVNSESPAPTFNQHDISDHRGQSSPESELHDWETISISHSEAMTADRVSIADADPTGTPVDDDDHLRSSTLSLNIDPQHLDMDFISTSPSISEKSFEYTHHSPILLPPLSIPATSLIYDLVSTSPLFSSAPIPAFSPSTRPQKEPVASSSTSSAYAGPSEVHATRDRPNTILAEDDWRPFWSPSDRRHPSRSKSSRASGSKGKGKQKQVDFIEPLQDHNSDGRFYTDVSVQTEKNTTHREVVASLRIRNKTLEKQVRILKEEKSAQKKSSKSGWFGWMRTDSDDEGVRDSQFVITSRTREDSIESFGPGVAHPGMMMLTT